MGRYDKELQEEINSTPDVQYDESIREEISDYLLSEEYRDQLLQFQVEDDQWFQCYTFVQH